MYISPHPTSQRTGREPESFPLTANQTVPIKGLQYITSPSLPASLQKIADPPAAPRNIARPLTRAAATSSCGHSRPQEKSVVNASTRQHDWQEHTSNFFAETLSSIGPSARRLLRLDAAEPGAGWCGAGSSGEIGPACAAATVPHSPPTARRRSTGRKLSAFRSEQREVGATQRNAATADVVERLPTTEASRGTLAATLDGTVTRRTWPAVAGTARSSTRRGLRLSATDSLPRQKRLSTGLPPNGIGGSAVTRDPLKEPPLVATLRQYLDQEVYLAGSGSTAPSALDHLAAYREAFGALISAFPGYSSLLSDIKSAYENVVQLQAELLTEAYVHEQRRVVSAKDHMAELTVLQAQVEDLKGQLQQSHLEMQQREAKREAELSAKERQSSAGARTSHFELRRDLERAEARVLQLEEMSKNDMEKILVLIGAVRECDRRIKELEGSVVNMSGQVEELDEFKRLAGEAQSELLRYKAKYQAFVPASDFEAMKEYLVAELGTAQSLVKRLRRTAAVRATQLDVMQRRVDSLQRESETLREEGARATSSPLSSAPEGTGEKPPLTPRPDWAAFEEVLPELGDYARRIHSYALPATADGTTRPSRSVNSAPAPTRHHLPELGEDGEGDEDGRRGTEEDLVVPGPDLTSMRIAYLVERVKSLLGQVATLEGERDSALKAAQQGHADDVVCGSHGLAGGASLSHMRSHQPSGERHLSLHHHHHPGRGSITNSGSASVGSGKRRSLAAGRNTEGDLVAPSGYSGVFGFPASAARGRLPMPLLGPGMANTVPPHFRCVGTVDRLVVDVDAGVRVIFEFFARVLRPMRAEDEAGALTPLDTTTVSARYRDFLTSVLDHGGIPPAPESALAGNEASRLSASAARSRVTTVGSPATKAPPQSLSLVPVGGPGALQGSAGATSPLHLPFSCAAHLAINLEHDARDPQLTNPAILLCSYVLSGAMPVRLATEAASVVERIVSDLNGLAAEAQKQRLQRSAVNECLHPVLELRTADELAELRSALGTDGTVDVIALTSMRHPFLRTLFFQECTDNMLFYTRLMRAVTEKARSREAFPAETAENCAVGDCLIRLEDVAAAVASVEPLTPPIVLRELSVNAVKRGEADDGEGGGDGVPREVTGDGATADDEATRVVKLSDIIRAIAEAPVIRRTRLSSGLECAL